MGRDSASLPCRRFCLAITFDDKLGKVDWDALKAGLRADNFDNGRIAAELAESFRRCHARVFARTDDGHIVGTARVLADGVCNAYLVDVWTDTPFRRQGIGSEMVRRLLATVPGHHVALFTQDHEQFYRSLGFEGEMGGCRASFAPGSVGIRPARTDCIRRIPGP